MKTFNLQEMMTEIAVALRHERNIVLEALDDLFEAGDPDVVDLAASLEARYLDGRLDGIGDSVDAIVDVMADYGRSTARFSLIAMGAPLNTTKEDT